MSWLGLDIGGANLKAADGRGFVRSLPFPLWKQPRQLAPALARLIGEAPAARRVAVTMTGELADCFATKREGVQAILTDVLKAAGGRDVAVYLTDGTLVEPETARQRPLEAAASNWHALARFAGRFAPRGTGLLIDVGSTTCDLIPLREGAPVAAGNTDPSRLASGELVYTGIERTPVCGIVQELPYQGAWCPVAAEWFATTWDAYLLLGDLPEETHRRDTADGRPATKPAARDRLARCVCADRESFSHDDARVAAGAIAAAQLEQLRHAAGRVIGRQVEPPATVVLSGGGEFLALRLVERLGWTAEIISLGERLGGEASRAAAAFALATLAREEMG